MKENKKLRDKYIILFGLICFSFLCVDALYASSSSSSSGGSSIAKAGAALTQVSTFMTGEVWGKGSLTAVVVGLLGALFTKNVRESLIVCGLGIFGGLAILIFG